MDKTFIYHSELAYVAGVYNYIDGGNIFFYFTVNNYGCVQKNW